MAKKKNAVPPLERPATPPPVARPSTILAWLNRHSLVCAIGLVLLATVRIAATYTVFNHTYDEPAHIACGMEWLDRGTYTWEPQHPPLSRVAVALGPYLLGIRAPELPKGNTPIFLEGREILDSGHHYDLTLALARAGILPFFWIACAVVFWWGRRYFSPAIGVAALALFSFLPTILAHAGLATTDMALTAFLSATFLCGMIWLEEPTPRHAIWFGASAGLMVLSKFSCLVFLPAAAALALVWYYIDERPSLAQLGRGIWQRLPQLGMAVGIALLIIWTGYRFSFGKVYFSDVHLPFPELFAGIKQVMAHNTEGHSGYLLGERRITGFWYFYEVALAVKTPLAFLALLGFGIALAGRRQPGLRRLYAPFCFSVAILVVGAFSHINIGIRHVLPIYVGFSLLAAVAGVRMIERGTSRAWIHWTVVGLAAWFGASSLLSHPDYLPYFNLLAGSQPEKILVDSDLDWGQDLKRLGARLRAVHAPDVAFVSSIVADLQGEFGFPKTKGFRPAVPVPGWNAVSVTMWKELRLGLGESYIDAPLWPDAYMKRLGDPTVPQPERIGKGILLWYFPE
ncbi:MAG TPA: glycosyltransferase family 39 protein [Candidatus Sulfopaludibacter sp.]|jgi:hypothetical protein|nr:glycosyltransferase family 39 protein [Candidatus Sulfopaludibacter sp.]